MIGSALATLRLRAAPSNYTHGRECAITEICIHHMAGALTAADCGDIFATVGRNGSAHYGIGIDGVVGQYVSEDDTAWANGNWESNCRAISIETANDSTGGEWHVDERTLELLIQLVADIAIRNGIGRLTAGKNLTWHSMYAATECPGAYLRSCMAYIANMANAIIAADKPAEPVPGPADVLLDNTPDGYAEEAVVWAVENGILKGTTGGDYMLHEPITRQDMIVFLHRALNNR